MSHFTSPKRPVSLETKATDWLRRPAKLLCGVVGDSVTFGYFVLLNEILRKCFSNHQTRRMYSSTRLLIADSVSSVRSMPRLVYFRTMCVVELMF